MTAKAWPRWLIQRPTLTNTSSSLAPRAYRSLTSSKRTSTPIWSAARASCAIASDRPKIYASYEGGARYGFEPEKLKDGDQFTFGETVMTVKHTPGHTPEHVSYLIAEKKHADTPWGVLTGDSLFVNSAGRPDLLGSSETKKLAEQQFHTLRDFYLKLPDSVIIYPAHGHGSPCGADIGDRLESTIGYERRFNPFLQFQDVKSFTDYALSTAPPVPKYYPLMKKINAKGPEVLGNLPRVPGLPPKTFKQAIEEEAGVLVDTRTMLGFGGGHIAGALNIGGTPMLSIWAGWLLDPDKPLLLVLDSDADLEKVVKLFIRTGYTKFAGYLAGGMKSWDNAGFELAESIRRPFTRCTRLTARCRSSMFARRANGNRDMCRAHGTSFSLSCEKRWMSSIGKARLPPIATAATGPASPPAS